MISRGVKHWIGVQAVSFLAGSGLIRAKVRVVNAVKVPVGRSAARPINVVVEGEVRCGLD